MESEVTAEQRALESEAASSLSNSRPNAPASLRRLAQDARDFAAARASANTRRAYDFDWAIFAGWCASKGVDATLPSPEVVGLFLTAMAKGDGVERVAASTIERRLSAITTTYRTQGTPLDRNDRHIVDVLAGIKRTLGRPPVKKQALFPEDVKAMLGVIPQSLRGMRDRAILLVGFAGGLRRSEIVGLDCGPEQTEDCSGWIDISAEGILLTVQGKTGWRHVEIGRGSNPTTCPVDAIEKWLAFARIQRGPVFRRVRGGNRDVGSERLNDEQVARLVKSAACRAGIKGEWPEARRQHAFSGHSLRSGFASSASVEEAQIQRQLGHASAELTRRYRQERERFRVNLTKAVGL